MWRETRRLGATDLVTKILLAGILVVLVVLVFLVVQQRSSTSPKQEQIATAHSSHSHGGDGTTQMGKTEAVPPQAQGTKEMGREVVAEVAVQANQQVARPPEVPPPPPMVGRPDRIREVLQEGKTYQLVVTWDLTGPVREKEWGLQTTVNMAYRAEMDLRRHIKKNDGFRLVELREIGNCRMVKATSTVDIQFVYTEPGSLLFGAIGAGLGLLDAWLTGGQISTLAASLIAPLLAKVHSVVEARLNEHNTKVQGMLDSLSGKTVQITFVDGMGVVELTPIDCTLSQEERDLLFTSAVVSDAFLLPDVESKPGDAWEVDGAAFTDFVPPSWRGTPRGKILIRREQDFEKEGKKYARLRCAGTVAVDATDASRLRLATLSVRGYLNYNIAAGHIESGELLAEIAMQEASRDHLLFETRFESQPRLRVTYFCQIVDSR